MTYKKTTDNHKTNIKTWLDFARYFGFEGDNEELSEILIDETCFPFDTQIAACQLRSYLRKKRNSAFGDEAFEYFTYTSIAIKRVYKTNILKNKEIPGKDITGVIKCPRCGSRLAYHVSSYNGHTMGACETKDCINWME